MAKILYTAVVADMRGKLNGTVFSKNRGGAYTRTKVTPSNPRTTAQNTVRQRLATYSQGWRALTATQLAAWNAAVENYKKTDIFGAIKNPSGINLYVKINANLTEAGQAAITLPALPGAVTGPVSLTLTGAAGANTLSLAYTATPVAAGMTWIVYATPQVSPGVSFVKNQFRKLGTIAAAAASPDNIDAAYTAKFGTLVAGQKIYVQVVAVNNTTGQKSPPLSTFCVVAA